MNNIIFIPMDVDGYLLNSGSQRIRCEWVAPYLKADIYDGSQYLDKYDIFIYQKAFLSEKVKKIAEQYRDRLQIFDICDPIHLFYPNDFKWMVERCEFITSSNDELTEELKYWIDKPIYTVPDRINLNFITVKKKHIYMKSPKLVWFGYSGNFHIVEYWRKEIEELGLDFTVISDFPTSFGKFVKWDLSTFQGKLIENDIVFNPRIKFKSNNKTIMSWALDMPVAIRPDEIARFIDKEERMKEVFLRRKEVESFWDVKQSAKEYENLIKNYAK